ncbi:MAG: type II toxin-antitoxin system RelE/ParE family toxin [Planctomycetia bacterium]|nr:type II toxin-antitoxin system RelE/ParE family toxin [Planctomycetia bacterium]
MTVRVVFRREARGEFDEAHDWYECQQPGRGDRFAERVEEVLARIAALPRLHQCVYLDVRRALVRDFPYLILYRVLPKQIRVIAVFHTRRDPTIWQSRI